MTLKTHKNQMKEHAAAATAAAEAAAAADAAAAAAAAAAEAAVQHKLRIASVQRVCM